jgi:putative ABC transport system permease protein
VVSDERTGRVAPPLGLWLRWSLRDLRARWAQVAAISLVIALGVGTYTGLSSSGAWRRASYDASYRSTNVHDLLVETAEGTTADRDALLAAIASIEHPEWIEGTTTALMVPVQVDASTVDETILVPGRLVGVELEGPGADIDRLAVTAGQPLTPGATGQVLIDEHFTTARQLAPTGTLRLSGGEQVDYVGTALSPRYFLLGAETGAFFGAAGYAVLFAPLEEVQALADKPGQVSEVGIALAPGVDVAAARAEIDRALAAEAEAALSVTPLTEEPGYRLLYDDIEGDQKLYTIFAGLILAGAAFAAFNLTGRIVEAQRREIGVGMSLGVPTRLLSVRPLLLAFEVALVGSILGVGVGLGMSAAMGSILESFFPMPVWQTSIQPDVFVRGAAVGIVLTFGACIWPVARAVRVPPIEAIHTGPRRTSSGGLAPIVQRLPLPGRSLAQLPLRNVLRAPRRTVLTALGIAAMIATLIGVIGMADSFFATIDRGEAEILGDAPDRLTVSMQSFTLDGSPEVAAVADAAGVANASNGLRIGGSVTSGDQPFDILLDVVDLTDGAWTPSTLEGSLVTDEPSLVLSEKAAQDLDVHAGDTVTLRHPLREGAGYRWVESEVLVGAIHPNPYRFVAYMDRSHADLFDLEGVVNLVEVQPEPGADADDVRRALFGLPGVGSVQAVAESVTLIRDTMSQFLDVLLLVEWAVLLLAVLIAFNSSSIGADERAREHATMFAFGVPPHTVLAIAVAESFIIGLLATAMGVLAGLGLLAWMVGVLIPTTLPDILVVIEVSPSTYLLAALLGIVAVALAPVLTLRKLRRMDIPSTLRVVE